MEKINLPFIMIASDMEMREILKRMSLVSKKVYGEAVFFFGRILGKDIVMVKTGVGAKKAGSATSCMLQRFTPSSVLVIGVAGAVDPHLNVGDIVVAKSIMLQKGTALPCHGRMTRQALLILNASGFQARAGIILAVDGFVHKKSEKAKLFVEFRTSVIDMESGAAAQKLHAAGIPFLDVRIVSDTARSDTADLETFYRQKKRYGSAAATLTMIRQPMELVRMVRFFRDVRRVSSKIAQSIELFLHHGFFDIS